MFDFKETPDFTPAEKTELIQYSMLPGYELICRMMYKLVLAAREEVDKVAPHQEREVIAANSASHGARALYGSFLTAMEKLVEDQHNAIKLAEAQAAADDAAQVERIILSQAGM